MYILAGEIGGKKSTFALFTHKIDSAGKRIIDAQVKSKTKTFSCEEYEDYCEKLPMKIEKNSIVPNMIKTFIEQHCDSPEKIYGACLGISGPVNNEQAIIDRSKLKTTFTKNDIKQVLPCKFLPVYLLNDMEAIGYSIFLGNEEEELNKLSKETHQRDPKDRRALMLVGEGLGKACWYWNEKEEALRPFSSEGGHADYASRTDDEDKLLKMLREQKKQKGDLSPVSTENVLSETGLVKIYQYIQKTRGYGNESLEQNQSLEQNSKEASQIIEKAQQQNDSVCKDALDMFISIWGAEAGNLALWFKAQGGVYIGGITIPIEKLKEGAFMEAFTNKAESHRSYNESISVKIFSTEDIVLLGAARFAIDDGFVTKGEAAYGRMN
ncbi:glucokinase [Nostoc sp.]|uniref:glucokinase n=1 Tax=Nostoc sp. TaxID=1180 RepID=UPI002FF47052